MSTRRLRIAVFSPYEPRALSTQAGGVFLREWVRRMAQLSDLTVVTPGGYEIDSRWAAEIVQPTFVELAQPGHPSPLARLRAGLGPPRGWLERHGTTIAQLIDQADIVEVQWPQMTGVIRNIRAVSPTKPIAYVTHDLRMDSLASQTRQGPLTMRMKAAAKLALTFRQERSALRDCDLVWCFKDADCRSVNSISGQSIAQRVEPYFDTTVNPTYPSGDRVTRIGFIGDLTRPENELSIISFLEHVWPELRRSLPGIELHVLGRMPESYVLKGADSPGVVIHGWVSDLSRAYDTFDIAIAPLQVQGGIKFKVAEAVAFGKPVVCSGVAAAGYSPALRSYLSICDDVNAWVSSLKRLCTNPSKAQEQARRARSILQSDFDFDESVRSAVDRYEHLVASGGRNREPVS